MNNIQYKHESKLLNKIKNEIFKYPKKHTNKITILKVNDTENHI